MGGGGTGTDGEAALRTLLRRAAAIAEDQRWADDPVAMVEEVQREAFAAGAATTDSYARGLLAAAAHVERIAPSLPACAWTQQRAITRALRELAEPTPPTGATAPQESA